MARSPATGEGSVAEATTLIFPKKSAWEEAAEAKRTAKKRSSSANGTFSKVLARLVEEEHVDRRAMRIVLALDAIEDDLDLHVTVHHLIDGMKKLGVLKRAQAQEEMFDNDKIDTAAADSVKAPRGGKGRKGKGATGDDLSAAADGNVTPIGAAARKVAEAAGGPI
jgi:hypothetical protein